MPEEAKIINYPANSHKAKSDEQTIQEEEAREKKIESVVKGKVTQRKPSLGKRIAQHFTGDDAKSVGEYILMDVFIPAAKTMLADAASQGAERLLFGDVRSRPRSSQTASNIYRPSYSSYSKPAARGPRETPLPANNRRAQTSGRMLDDIVLETRAEAEDVLEGMSNIVEKYDQCTVADLKELLGITGSHIDDKWGWYDLRGADVKRIREGYLLILDPVESIQ